MSTHAELKEAMMKANEAMYELVSIASRNVAREATVDARRDLRKDFKKYLEEAARNGRENPA